MTARDPLADALREQYVSIPNGGLDWESLARAARDHIAKQIEAWSDDLLVRGASSAASVALDAARIVRRDTP